MIRFFQDQRRQGIAATWLRIAAAHTIAAARWATRGIGQGAGDGNQPRAVFGDGRDAFQQAARIGMYGVVFFEVIIYGVLGFFNLSTPPANGFAG